MDRRLEAMLDKVHSESGRRVYQERQSVAKSPLGVIKATLGVRQFLSRGLEKVRSEWRWICAAHNLRILTAWVRRHRHLWADEVASHLAPG